MTDLLATIFGGKDKVKILRLFLLNPESGFDAVLVASKSRVQRRTVSKILADLLKIGFIKKKKFTIKTSTKKKTTPKQKKQRKKIAKKKAKKGTRKSVAREIIVTRSKIVHGFALDPSFPHRAPLQALVLAHDSTLHAQLLTRLKSTGHIQLCVVSGAFIGKETPIDLLIVGDALKEKKIASIIANVEADMGKELSYAIFETSDFTYRHKMYDRLIRDIFDFSHTIISISPKMKNFLGK